MLFPHISHIDELRAHVHHKPEIRFMPQADGTTVVCYLIADNKTFDSNWAAECRGITFDSSGKLVCRPLHKFFNLGENEANLPGNLPWNELSFVTEKLDGSMLTPYLLGDTLRWKTKKSAESDVAKMAHTYAETLPDLLRFCRDTIAAGDTPIFEFTAPLARVVVGYSEPKLTLLHIRNMRTGEYRELRTPEGTPSAYAREIGREYGVELAAAYPVSSWESLNKGLPDQKNMEGYILGFGSHMVKVKGDWYLAAHRIVSFIRERDVASFVVNEQLDDVLAVLREVGADLTAVNAVARRVVEHVVSIQQEVEGLAISLKGEESRVVAQKLADHPLRGLVLNVHQGKNVDYLTHFKKHHLKTYPLTQLPTRDAEVDFHG